MTTFKDIEIEPFPHPDYASEGLNAIVDMAHEYIQSSVVLFASGFDGGQQDMIAWLAKKNMLSEEGRELTKDGAQHVELNPGQSVMADNYTSKNSEVRDRASQLRMQNENVNESSIKSFKTSNQAFQKVKGIADGLRAELGRKPGEHQLTRKPDGNLHLTSEEENRLLGLILEEVDRVHDTIEDADSGMRRDAGNIEKMIPDLPRNPYGNAPDAGRRTPWTPTSKWTPETRSLAITRYGTPNGIVGVAQNELGNDVIETNGDNVPIYRKTGLPTEYNIKGLPWCAAFSTWVWDKAGYKVGWSNENYVPAIWSDAEALGLRRAVSQAQPGDMIIFDWEHDGTPDHVGIVEAVDYNTGQIHTIEGNSSNRLQQRSYSMNAGSLFGVVTPPAETPAAQAS
ncbi:CHAP domain-containing protein [Nocardia brevicatena]|uniref:CHAP domain-containing protein n=1 Tax=Nocardia brevicatena TaxID=37327 RepID=UPI000592D770|nr:CHAP domain-containing protein [Nocardia brevicatena]